MSLAPLTGHIEVRKRLAGAARQGRLPQVLLLEGAEGVGRQRIALWLAQLLFCEKKALEPCGSCRACRLTGELSHADLHWIIPVLRPKATDADKQIDEVAELIGEAIAERRKHPLYGALDGMASHPLATVRLIQRRAALTSVEGGPKVFILGHAERLVPQESSQDASNALLKLLEEPPADSWFILTATDAGRLLPTIRSRVAPVRLGRLSAAEVRSFLAAELKPALAPAVLEERVRTADGSIGAALSAADAGAKAVAAAADLLDAALKGPAARADRVLRQPTYAARGEFTAMLEALEESLGDAARAATGSTPRRAIPAPLKGQRPVARLLKAQELVNAARETAQGNVNPQLLVGVLALDLAEALGDAGQAPAGTR
jgi:DNA polymerase III subunit delta'